MTGSLLAAPKGVDTMRLVVIIGQFDPTFPLQKYGLDSLGVVEVVIWIGRHVRSQGSLSWMLLRVLDRADERRRE